MKKTMLLLTASVLALVAPTGAQQPKTEYSADVQSAIKELKDTDSTIKSLFDKAYGYVVFANVSKGALIVGGAGGGGEVYNHGQLIGTASLSQVTVGAQVGGQVYSEVIFFENQAALERFKESRFELSAQAGAVAAAEGAAATAKYQQGVVIFTMPQGGLMVEASVGGQKFEFRPLPK